MMTHNQYTNLGEQVYSEKLSNGLSVFVVPKPGFYKKFAYFATNYGGVDRRFKIADKWIDTPAGVAHFLEHKLFETKDGNALDLLSQNGASPNAYTSNDLTAYYFECGDKFRENLEILLSFVSIPYFTPESVEKEQGIITQEIRMGEDDPDFNLYYGLLKSLYKHKPLRDSVAGTVESIGQITSELLYDCHRIFYNPSNMALCVVGDVDPADIFDTAHKTLPQQPGEVPLRDYGTSESLIPEVSRAEKAMDVSLPVFNAGLKINPVSCGKEKLKLEIISYMALELMLGHSSPLYLRLYADGQINSDFGFSVDSAAKTAYIVFGGEARDPQFVFAEVQKEILKICEGGADTELLKRIKKASMGSTIRAYNSFSAIASSISEGHFQDFDSFDAINILKAVTVDDILNFIADNIIPDHMAISIINPL
ncbi:MAG: insulinase family protein [Oscillospiraceae bacterium]|nr:insulinase family protein [Oscillospiraceae bacterium]